MPPSQQRKAPLLDALRALHRQPHTAFTPPGHRQGAGVDPRVLDTLGADVFVNDVLLNGNLDDRAAREGLLAKAEDLMAEAVGADAAFFSTCGSSLSVKAAMLAVAGRAGSLLLSRDAHKSAIAGLVLGGIDPRWIRPRWDPDLHLAHPPSPDLVRRELDRNPDVGGVMITSPTPYGTCADLASIAASCHEHGKPLLVDEAWGAHLPFHPDLPAWAMDAGADLCVVSAHKMGAGLEQGSIFHVQGDLIDRDHLAECADMLATTSPNVLIYAAIDGWRRQMVEHGERLLGDALDLARSTRRRLGALPGITVLEEQFLGVEASKDLDRLDITMEVGDLGISGYQAADWLRENRQLDVHLCDHRRIEAQFSIADSCETAHRLYSALTDLIDAAPGLPPAAPVYLPEPGELELDTVMSPRDAFFSPVEDIAPEDAVGRVVAEQVTPYPPGIPVLLPGEQITEPVIEYLTTGKRAGMFTPDPADPDLGTIRVVA